MSSNKLKIENGKIPVINGPGKFELMISVFDGRDNAGTEHTPRRSVSFIGQTEKGENEPLIPMFIQSICRADGGGELFDLHCYGKMVGGWGEVLAYRGSYDVRTRTGWLELVPPNRQLPQPG